MRNLFWVIPVLSWSAAASAQPADCSKALDQTSMNICAGDRYKAADKALNETYRALMARIGAEGRAALERAEANWIAFRDADCDFETLGSRGGSIHPFVQSLCLADLTEHQTRRLDQQLHCQEGDASCGGQ